MVQEKFALLETGCNTVDEFVAAFYDHKSVHYKTSNIRTQYCDGCPDVFSDCSKCFIHKSLQEIYKNDPFA